MAKKITDLSARTSLAGTDEFENAASSASYRTTLSSLLTWIRAQTAVGARVYNSANISVPNTTLTALTFDSERFDTAALHSTSSNTSRLVAPVAGLYSIVGHASFAASAGGTLRQISLRMNGTQYISSLTLPSTNIIQNLVITVHWQMAASDYVELMAFQDSGGALNVLFGADYSPALSMVLL